MSKIGEAQFFCCFLFSPTQKGTAEEAAAIADKRILSFAVSENHHFGDSLNKPRPHVADAKRSATSFTSAGEGHVASTGGEKMTGTQMRATRFGWTFLFGVPKMGEPVFL